MRFTITMSDSLSNKLKEITKSEKITKSQLIEILVRKGLENDKLLNDSIKPIRQVESQ